MPTAKEVFENYILAGKTVEIKFKSNAAYVSFRSMLYTYKSRTNTALKEQRAELIKRGFDAPDFVDCLDNKMIVPQIISKDAETGELVIKLYAAAKETVSTFEIISVT